MNDIDKRVVNPTVHREAVSYLSQVRFFAACEALGIERQHWLSADISTLINFVRERISVIRVQEARNAVYALMKDSERWEEYRSGMDKSDYLRFTTIVYYIVANVGRITDEEVQVGYEEILEVLIREGFFEGGQHPGMLN